MTSRDHDAEAVLAYRRTLEEVASNQVVAAAEDILTDVWIAELERVRRETLAGADTLGDAHEAAARDLVRRAQDSGDPAAAARARALLSEVEATREADLHAARLLVEAVDAELEHAGRAALKRAQRVRDDLFRLHAAWRDAYGRDTRDER
jgi:hypothetical protein